MTCPKCSDRGWTESYMATGASFTPSLQQCPSRCNISGYSREVQRRLNNPEHVTERPVVRGAPLQRPLAAVIEFRNPRDEPKR